MGKPVDARKILADNLLKIRGEKSEDEFGRQIGVSQRTAHRLCKQKTATTVDTLAVIAAKLRIEPWQLLVEGLDLANQPVIAELTEQERSLYAKLISSKHVTASAATVK